MVKTNLKQISKNQKWLTPSLLLIAILTILALISHGSNIVLAAEPIPVTGTWNGIITGTTPVQKSTLRIDFDAVVSGTFEGDTSSGDWKGEFNTNYTVSPVGIEEEDLGTVIGGYIVTIDDSGAISGEGVAEISGALTGSLTFDITGQKSDSGEISGTWKGILTSETLNYGGTPVAIDAKFDASGEFRGNTKAIETPSPTQTTPSPTATTLTTTEPTTASPTPTPISKTQTNDQYFIYAIIGAIAIIIVVGFYIYRIRRAKAE
jgi:hypothetical protein